MPRRPLAHVDAESSGRTTAIEMARAQLFDVDADRKKRIDDAIDYFGGGTSMSLGRVSRSNNQVLSNSDRTSEPAWDDPAGHGATCLATPGNGARASSPVHLALPTANIWEATNGSRRSSSPHPKQAR